MRKILVMTVLTLLVLAVSAAPAQTVYKGGVEPARAGKEPLRVIMIGAHPDDSEIKGGGTAALWAETGAKVLLVAVTNGDAGHQSEGGGALARRRAAEAQLSAERLGVSWKTLGFHDGELEPTLEARKAVIRTIREWKADIVILPRPNDYHPDHRYTAQIVQDVAYMVMVPNICPDTPRLEKNPVFMYFLDGFQKPIPFKADIAVVVDPVMEKKWGSVDAMDSQMYEWLPWIAGYLDEVPKDKKARYEWVKNWRGMGMQEWKKQCADVLEERYGKDKAAAATFVEAFEICEFGRQPERAELWGLFPK